MHLAGTGRKFTAAWKKKKKNAGATSPTPPVSQTPPPPRLSSSHPLKTKQTNKHTVEGVLKGYDQLLNLVLDEAIEYQRSADDLLTVTDETRPLGLVVCRGTAVMAVAPTAGAEVMASNPFLTSTTAEEGGAAAEEAAAA